MSDIFKELATMSNILQPLVDLAEKWMRLGYDSMAEDLREAIAQVHAGMEERTEWGVRDIRIPGPHKVMHCADETEAREVCAPHAPKHRTVVRRTVTSYHHASEWEAVE